MAMAPVAACGPFIVHCFLGAAFGTPVFITASLDERRRHGLYLRWLNPKTRHLRFRGVKAWDPLPTTW